jgi:ABC-type transport system substrate-binding protein
MPFGNFSDARVDELVEQQRLETNPDKRKALVQEVNKITSDKVASAFLFHVMDILVYTKAVNFPPESRIPGLVDLDRTTVS